MKDMVNYYMKKNFQKEYPDIIEEDLKQLLDWWDKWKHLFRTTGNMPPPPMRDNNMND
ncbi:MAG: hypothetical protein ACOCV8_01715 [Spirochaetota bacterium]